MGEKQPARRGEAGRALDGDASGRLRDAIAIKIAADPQELRAVLPRVAEARERDRLARARLARDPDFVFGRGARR